LEILTVVFGIRDIQVAHQGIRLNADRDLRRVYL
jgi:hypothetical protein